MVAYLRGILPHASDNLLHAIKETLSGNDGAKARYDALLSEIEQHISRPKAASQPERGTTSSRTTQSKTHWRQRVRAASQSLAGAENWMDVDDDVTDRQYARFYLLQIKDYFELVSVRMSSIRFSLCSQERFSNSRT